MRKSSYLILSTTVAALGGFLFGFDTAVISGTTQDLERLFGLDEVSLGFTVGIALFGTIIGSIAVGKPGELYGGKKVLIVMALFYLVSSLGSALSNEWITFLIYRFLGGLAVGGASVMAPLYIAEISPALYRGRLVAINQLNIVTGILVSFFSNYLMAVYVHHDQWRWMLGVQAIPSLLFFIFLYFIPDSPRWLIRKGRVDEAKKVLTDIGELEVDKEVQEIKDSMHFVKGMKTEPLFSKKYFRPVMLAILLAFFNQMSGINAIIYYAPRIFEMTGIKADMALLQSVAIGATNLVFTFAALFFIDRYGRRTLMLLGSIGTAFCLAMVAYAFYTDNFSGYFVLFCLIGFIAFFAFSQGAVIWVFLSEIFPNKVRAKGQSLGSFTHWVMAWLVSSTFPKIVAIEWIGGGHAFMFFSAMMVLQFLFVWKIMPETKDKSLEYIQREMGID